MLRHSLRVKAIRTHQNQPEKLWRLRCTTCRTDGTSVSKRMEIKNLIAELKKVNPHIESNIFRSVENVNLHTVIAYKKDGVKHSFLEGYDD